jgi:hypothetical protein
MKLFNLQRANTRRKEKTIPQRAKPEDVFRAFTEALARALRRRDLAPDEG